MSFGFGIGDFIAIIQLTNEIRKSFIGAPEEFKSISLEVRGLSIVLQDVNIFLSEREPDPSERADLESIVHGCRKVLDDLHRTLEPYQVLDPEAGRSGNRLKKAWKRVTLDDKELDKLRDRITSNVGMLNAFGLRFTRDRVVKLLRYQEDRLQSDVLNWLTPINYAPQHNALSSQRLEDSGKWFLDSDEFKNWVDNEGKTLFCQGIPGAGKTFITSAVVDELIKKAEEESKKAEEGSNKAEEKSGVGIAYIYCGFQQKNEPKALDFLTSLLKQLAEHRPSLPASIKDLHAKHKSKRTRPTFDDISKALRSTGTEYSRLFIVIDALDEFPEEGGGQAKFMSEVFALQSACGANIYATSRFSDKIAKSFGPSPRKEIRASEEDVRLYLDAYMGQLPSFVQENEELQRAIRDKISAAVGGMFLLARIYLDSLVDQLTVNALETELRELAKPPSSSKDEGLQKKLHEAYHKSMEKIDHQRLGFRDLALQVLAWVTCAKRPLTASELQQALAVKSATKVDEGDLFRIEDMVSVCAGLVPSADDSGIIRLAHYTAHDYLRGDRHNWFPDAETKIMTACVNYLSFDAFEEGFCNTDKDFEARLSTYPFYDYAARNWGHHACAALGTDPCPDLILNFLENDTKVSASVQAMMVFARYTKFSQEVPKKMTGVHLAAYFGLLNAIQGLHRRGHELEAKDTWGRTPLSWAAQKGKTEVVKWLLANGAAPDSEATVPFLSGCTPLWFAVQNGHKGVTEVLLATKIDFDSAIAERQTPLARAARNGHEAVVQLLVEKGAKVDSKDVNGRTPLSLAAGNGHEDVVQYLLDHGADINLTDVHNRTPLSFAAENGREAVVQTLLSKTEVDASTEDQAGKTPLIYAQGNGFDHVVKRIQSFNSLGRHGVQE